MTGLLRFRVNGRAVEVDAPPASRLTRVLRDHLGLTGTKVGCDAGDCGACTVLLDGEQVCACLVSLGQVASRSVTTVEGLVENGGLSRLQRAFHAHGAAQCGICTPGMLMAASTLLGRPRPPTESEVLDALGGVLCRCTGYRKIVRAVLAATNGESSAAGTDAAATDTSTGTARYVGRRLPSVDGVEKVTGRAVFGADEAPDGALRLRVVRSPYPHARFTLGDCTALHWRYPGLARVLTAADVPGVNGFGIYPDIKDQPVLAPGIARYRGEAVAALVGDDDTIDRLADDEIPIDWEPLPALRDPRDATAPGAEAVQPAHPDNVLTRGRVHAGTVPPAGRYDLFEASDELLEASGKLVETSGKLLEASDDGLVEARVGRRVRDPLHRARLHRAGGGLGETYREWAHRGGGKHPDAVHGPGRGGQRARHRARPRPHPALRVRRWLRRQARPVRPALGRAGRVAARGAGALHLHAHRVHDGDHQAASVAHSCPCGGGSRRASDRLRVRR